MYAVVSTGGKQLKVEKGAVAVVEKLDAAVGDAVMLDVVFIADGDTIVTDVAALSSAKVTAEVVEHFKGEKAVVFKFKKRKGYKRTKGHRQQLTRVLITEIGAASAEEPKPKRTRAKKADAAEATVETAPAAETTPVAETAEEPKPKRTRAKKEAEAAPAEAAPAESGE